MARQSTTPVEFNITQRYDRNVTMTSGRAGVVVPVGFAPLLPGDSASGTMGIDVQLAEMPKPLLNGVFANIQAWFVPKSAHPQFSGREELMHAMTGKVIRSLGSDNRTPPPYFYAVGSDTRSALINSTLFKTLGLHVPIHEGPYPNSGAINTDLVDAFNLIYNFRLAAHSSRLPRRKYVIEDAEAASTLPPAFWPSQRFGRVVPDYERALVVGALDLDVAAGRLPVTGIGKQNLNIVSTNVGVYETGATGTTTYPKASAADTGNVNTAYFVRQTAAGYPDIWAEMGGQSVSITLADIDKARTTQAFAKLRTAYEGNDTTGFRNDDTIVSLLMRGLSVPEDQFKRPWLLDSARVPVGFAERPATDGANLDKSVTTGRASATLRLNVPAQDVGGVIIFTVEVLPERIDERMSDEWLMATHIDHLPNALRDIQRVEPVDLVQNRRIDAKHTTPHGLYGYEPMNDKWNRDTTRLGGVFYMATPGGGWTENRSAIWQTEIVNPTFSSTHFLAPQPFPHDVFADQLADAFEVVCRHNLTISGLTQIGDVLAENNDDYEAVLNEG